MRCFFGTFLFCCFFLISSLKAQNNNVGFLKDFEDSCVTIFKQIKQSQNVENNIELNNKLREGFKRILNSEASFNYPFDSLKMLGKLYAPDQSFRIITWCEPVGNGNFLYFGFIQMAPANKQVPKVFELIDKRDEVNNPENSALSAGKWYGALYYKILRNKVDNNTYYTILGIQNHNALITRKIIEILYFDEWGNPVFGAPVIQFEKKKKLRIVLQFSAMSAANLKYDDKLKMIIFDHIAPADPKYIGMYEYYGPDLTFDGLKFVKNSWLYMPNLDLRRKTQTPVRTRRPR